MIPRRAALPLLLLAAAACGDAPGRATDGGQEVLLVAPQAISSGPPGTEHVVVARLVG